MHVGRFLSANARIDLLGPSARRTLTPFLRQITGALWVLLRCVVFFPASLPQQLLCIFKFHTFFLNPTQWKFCLNFEVLKTYLVKFN